MERSIYKEESMLGERNQKLLEREKKKSELDKLSGQLLNVLKDGIPAEDINNYEEYHNMFVRTRKLLNEEDFTNRDEYLKKLIEEIVRYITQKLLKNESSNILEFHSSYDILFELSNLFYTNGNGTIADELVYDLCNCPDSKQIDKKYYLIKIYPCSTPYGKTLIEKELEKKINNLSCKAIYYGVLSGVFSYDSEIENRLQDICGKRTGGFDHVDFENPIYTIIKLHIWGYIKNLSSYENHLSKSRMLRFALKPDTYEVIDFNPEWWPLLLYNPYRNALLNNQYNKDTIMKKLIMVKNGINNNSVNQIIVEGFKDTIYTY